jgi:hypothetical protein
MIDLDKSIKTKQNKLLFQIYGILTIDNNLGSNRPSLNAATTAAPTTALQITNGRMICKNCAMYTEYNIEKKIAILFYYS